MPATPPHAVDLPDDAPLTATGAPTGSPGAEAAPGVTAVVTTCDPGPWFEEALTSLVGQDYPELHVVVVDVAGTDPAGLRARVHAVAPGARIERVEESNLAGAVAKGAESDGSVDGVVRPFLLLCHDDVRLAPDALRLLLEELFRSNAGIVGPKLVDWDDQARLRQVGMTVDRTGEPVGLVEPGELDQEQHDAVRDVFFVPGGCLLVRTDLFRALGGYDPGIPLVGEDRDLCWRAHVAGARVLVVPAAVAAHREELSHRMPEAQRVRLEHRHRIRTLLVTHGAGRLVRVVFQALVVTLVGGIAGVLSGRGDVVRAELAGWAANVRSVGELRSRRRQLAALRQVSDGEVHRLQLRGSARLLSYLRGPGAGSAERFDQSGVLSRAVAARLRAPEVQRAIVVWLVALAVLVVGSRHLLTAGLPATGELVSFPDTPRVAFDEFRSSGSLAGVGAPSAPPSLLAVLALLGWGALGQMAVLRTLLAVGTVLAGWAGAWRLAGATGDRRGQAVALAVFAACPLGINALGRGHASVLVAAAMAPFLLAALARVTGQAPFRAPRWEHSVLVVGLLVGLGSLVIPTAGVLAMVVAVGLAVGSALTGQTRGAARVLGVAVLGSLVGWLVNLPWSLVWLQEWDSFARPRQSPLGLLPAGDLLRFHTGSVGGSWLSWGVLGAAALGLLIGREWRLGWAVRGWAVALMGWGAAFSVTQGWWPQPAPPLGVLLAPAAAGLALASAMGWAAFVVDLRDFHFGWRQVSAFGAGLAAVLALVPVGAQALVDGRWGGPGGDLSTTLSFVDPGVDEPSFRVLWLGDPEMVPLTGWSFDDASVYQVTTTGMPAVRDLFPAEAGGEAASLRDALDRAARGESLRLGADLGPLGIRYIVVPQRVEPGGGELVVSDSALVQALPEQLDLTRREVSSAVQVWESAPWVQDPVEVDTSAAPSGGRTVLALALGGMWVLLAVAAIRTRPVVAPAQLDDARPGPAEGAAP